MQIRISRTTDFHSFSVFLVVLRPTNDDFCLRTIENMRPGHYHKNLSEWSILNLVELEPSEQQSLYKAYAWDKQCK